MLVGIICTILVSAFQIIIPWIIKYLIDSTISTKDFYALNLLAVLLIILYILQSIFSYGQNYLIPCIGQKVIRDIREQVYSHLQRLSLRFYTERKTGEIMSNVLNDVNVLRSLIIYDIRDILVSSIILVGSIFFMFYIHWKLGLIIILLFPLIATGIRQLGKKVRDISKILQENMAEMSATIQESISSIRVVQTFKMEDLETERFKQINLETLRMTFKQIKLKAFLDSLLRILSGLSLIAVLWYGSYEVMNNRLTIGELFAFLTYIGMIIQPANKISNAYTSMQEAFAAADRIFNLLNIEPEIKDDIDAIELPSGEGIIRFENVTFGYQKDRLILKNISFEAKPGEIVALVGPSGSGKTTLVNLLVRFYDPTGGRITFDGYDIKKVKLSSLREKLSLVLQENILFSSTVAENIGYGRLDATMDEIIEAAKLANAHDFIKELPDGYQTKIGERGIKLSGGQQQRIAIARAILRNPRVLILDEATSSLDTESERLVKEALDRLMKDRTTLIIAHRLSTIINVTKIIVLDKGNIVEVGTHKELISKGGLYSKLYEIQFKVY